MQPTHKKTCQCEECLFESKIHTLKAKPLGEAGPRDILYIINGPTSKWILSSLHPGKGRIILWRSRALP